MEVKIFQQTKYKIWKFSTWWKFFHKQCQFHHIFGKVFFPPGIFCWFWSDIIFIRHILLYILQTFYFTFFRQTILPVLVSRVFSAADLFKQPQCCCSAAAISSSHQVKTLKIGKIWILSFFNWASQFFLCLKNILPQLEIVGKCSKNIFCGFKILIS